MVAKSFQSMKPAGEPFQKNGKMYINLYTAAGTTRTVRWYSEEEYAKLYPEQYKIQFFPKDAFGFNPKGYITIFKGNTYANLEWFKEHDEFQYATHLGWFMKSKFELPSDMPAGIEPVQLPWETVAKNDTEMLPAEEVKTIVRGITNPVVPSNSEYQGEIGERLTREVTVKSIRGIDNMFGHSNVFTFVDADENVYIWFTATNQTVEEGDSCTLVGTVKDHKEFRETKQTIVTRCKLK